MAQISETYASPLLRWALLLEDHADADYGYSLVKGKDLPAGHEIPAKYGGDQDFCLATITFPVESGLKPAYGYKNVDSGVNLKGSATGPVTNAEQWQQLCTKCLGRALKRCGYPDDMDELRAVIRWRSELSRLKGLVAGVPLAQLGAGDDTPVEEALAKASRPDGENSQTIDHDDEVPDAEVPDAEVPASDAPPASNVPDALKVDPPEPVPENIIEAHRQALNRAAQHKVQGDVRKWASEFGVAWTKPGNEAEAAMVIAKVDELIEAAG